MEESGLLFLSENASQLMGIPVRVYKNGLRLRLFFSVPFSNDPFDEYLSKLEEASDHISYFAGKHSLFYCILRSEEYQVVVGPFSYFGIDRQTISELSFQMNLSKEERLSFVTAMSAINPMPLETVLKSLISMNYTLNGEMLSFGDLLIETPLQNAYQNEAISNQISPQIIAQYRNSTIGIEETLMRFVKNGDSKGFLNWVKNAPAIKSGGLSSDFIRHEKNTFIVSTTLASRAAIEGGLDYDGALNLSDEYINRCETCRTANEITNLQFQMMSDYISRVERIKSESSPLESEISNYVYSHISEKCTLDDICEELGMSKSNLCLRFKSETGTSVSSFVLDKKIEEAKRLLSHSHNSIASISLYLGFSSQAHFTTAFKAKTGLSPMEYRKGS